MRGAAGAEWGRHRQARERARYQKKGKQRKRYGQAQRKRSALGEQKTSAYVYDGIARGAKETDLHYEAKAAVFGAAESWLKDKDVKLSVQLKCVSCPMFLERPLPGTITLATSVAAEVDVEDITGALMSADVAFMAHDKPVFIVEIFVTGAVSQWKAENLPVPWIEVFAEEVLPDPLTWKALRQAPTMAEFCSSCSGGRPS